MSPLDTSDPSQFGFPEGSIIYGCSTEVRREIVQASQRIRGGAAFQRFWDRVLSPNERDTLDGDVVQCFDQQYAPFFLVQLRGYSFERAIIEIAYRIEFLSKSTYEWLMHEIGDSLPQNIFDKPVWKKDIGRLEFRGEQAREVLSIADNVIRVFNDFENLEWPRCIDNPVESDNPQNIHEIVRSINDGLTCLRFGARKGRICWWPLPPSNSPDRSL